MKKLLVIAFLLAVLPGCKKHLDEAAAVRAEIRASDSELGTNGTGFNTSCEMRAVMGFISGEVSEEDYSSLEFDSATVFTFPEDEIRIYHIPFVGEDPNEKFAIVAAKDSSHMQGAFVNIEASNNWREDLTLDGDVTFESFDRLI